MTIAKQPRNITSVPRSKYLANRWLVLAALSGQITRLKRVPDNEDVRHLLSGIAQLGVGVEKTDGDIVLKPNPSGHSPAAVTIDCGDSGTMARFMLALAATKDYSVTIDGSNRLRERPMEPLLSALRQLGAQISSSDGHLPVQIKGRICGGVVTVDPGQSSQFVSALMLIAPVLPEGLEIILVRTPVSWSYIRMTADVLKQAGISCSLNKERIAVAPGKIQVPTLEIPVDATAASYMMMAGLLGPEPVRIIGYQYRPQLHGECYFVDHVARMGGELVLQPHSVCAYPVEHFLGTELDCSDCPDVVQSLAVLACFARKTVRLTGLQALPYKESNRIEDTARELRRCGVAVKTGSDWLSIGAPRWQPCVFETHRDHRMAMALAQLSWRVKGLSMKDSQVVSKSWPDYWQQMSEIGLPMARRLLNNLEN